MSKNDGGFAFPAPFKDNFAYAQGLTVRDYFAGQALPGVLHHYYGELNESACSKMAYKVADAMVQERAK